MSHSVAVVDSPEPMHVLSRASNAQHIIMRLVTSIIANCEPVIPHTHRCASIKQSLCHAVCVIIINTHAYGLYKLKIKLYLSCRCLHCGNIRHWWWVPVIAPMLGGAIAAFVYWFFIDAHHVPQRNGTSYHRVSADDSEEEGLLTHSKVSQEEVN